jgi:hypothetical protein
MELIVPVRIQEKGKHATQLLYESDTSVGFVDNKYKLVKRERSPVFATPLKNYGSPRNAGFLMPVVSKKHPISLCRTSCFASYIVYIIHN